MGRNCDYPRAQCLDIQAIVFDYENAKVAINHALDIKTTLLVGDSAEIEFESVVREFLLIGTRTMTASPTQVALSMVADVMDAQNPDGIVICGGENSDWDAECTVTENCQIRASRLHYVDLSHNIVMYDRITDKIEFTVTSNLLIPFRTQWGTFWSHYIAIPPNAATRTVEFVLLKDGVETVIHSTRDTISALPETTPPVPSEGDSLTPEEIAAAAEANIANIALILCVPQPPSGAMPTTANGTVLRMGFYDYNGMSNEFGKTLQEADGGKDFYYPEWCRNLLPNTIWRADTKIRYEFEGTSFTDTEAPLSLRWVDNPQCSYAVHPTLGEMWSWTFTDGLGQLQTYSKLNGIDPVEKLKAIVPNNLLGEKTAYHPISII